MDPELRDDPMIKIFPRVTKCTFHKYGPSGSIQTHDALCVLALNILNEKIYILLWFWFIILSIMSTFAVLYSMALLTMPSAREFILKMRFKFTSDKDANTLVRETQVG